MSPCMGGILYRSFAEEASEANILWIFFGSGPIKKPADQDQKVQHKFVGKSRLMAFMS